MSTSPTTTGKADEQSTTTTATEATSAVTAEPEPELSSTASPPASAAAEAQEAAGEQEAAPGDPKVAQLKAMFPEMTPDVLEAVLEAHGGSVEQASELLLSMNDPNPEHPSPAADADEQFARALQEEEQEHARREQQQRQAARQAAGGATGGAVTASALQYQAYVPRRRGQAGGAGNAALEGSTQAPQKDELDQLTEQFSKIAEQGKKTFGQLFGMAKEQIGKLNESINAPSSGPSGSASGSAPAPPPKAESGAWTPPSALPRPQQSQAAPPSVVPELLPRPGAPRDAPLPSVPASSAPAASTTESPAQPEQPKTDFTKIGLLPRQSVSLLDNKKGDSDSDEDDLEYTRNPFDRDD